MATIESGLASGLKHDIAAIFGQVYRVNGWDAMSVWDGYADSAVAAGIPAPPGYSTVAGSENVTTAQGQAGLFVTPGTHLVRYRYVNSFTQYPSNPTPTITIEGNDKGAGTGSRYNLSGLTKSSDPKVDRVAVEMTDAGGGTFFLATSLANSGWHSIALQTPDNLLRANPLFWDNFGHDIPPRQSFVEQFRGRLWGLGAPVYSAGRAKLFTGGTLKSVLGSGTQWTSAAVGRIFRFSGGTRRFIASVISNAELWLESSHASAPTLRPYSIVSEVPDVLRFSKPLFPESWPPENSIRTLDGKPEKARALKGFRQDLVLFGERSMERLVYGDDPFRDGALEPIEGERGAASRRCVVDVGKALWSLDYKGIHRYVGGEPEHISEAIDPLFDKANTDYGTVDFSYRTTFHAVHYPDRHQIMWFVVLKNVPGDSTTYTKPQHAIVYDYMNGTFTIHKFDVPMVASTIAPGDDGTSQTLIADENGRCWVFGIGPTDGIHTDSATSVYVSSGATTTNFKGSSATAFYNTGDGLAGAAAYWLEGTEVQLIQSNSASGCTVVAFSTAPATGDTIYLGRIPTKWKSKAFYLTTPAERRQDGRYLHLFYEPQSAGNVRLRFYLDRSSTAYDSYNTSTSVGNWKQEAHNDFFEIDITDQTGYAQVPMPSEGSHVIEFELEVVEAAAKLEVDGFELDGYVEEQDRPL